MVLIPLILGTLIAVVSFPAVYRNPLLLHYYRHDRFAPYEFLLYLVDWWVMALVITSIYKMGIE